MTRAFRFFLCVSLLTAVAHGFVLKKVENTDYLIVWLPGTVPIQLKLPTTTFQTESTRNYTSVLQDAIATWNTRLGTLQLTSTSTVTPILTTPVDGSSTVYGTNNKNNEIVVDSSVDGDAFGGNTLAVTMYYYAGNTRVEADIVFNSSVLWDSYGGALQQPRQDMERVALHELGHLLGLDHPDQAGQSVSAIMNSTVSNLDALVNDDIAGAQVLYGAPGVLPGNNNFSNAFELVLNSGSAQGTGTSVAATKEGGEPNPVGGTTGGRSIWWKWNAPNSGSATVTTAGSAFDTILGVYTGGSVGSLSFVAGNDDEEPYVQGDPYNPQRKRTSKITFSANAGTVYYFVVDGWDGEQGPVTINLTASAVSNTAPGITAHPGNQSINAGSSATFSVGANGTPSPTFQWQRLPAGTGAWVDLSNGGNYSGTSTTTLTVSSATVGMNGDQFRCIATNTVGNATSNAATLTVAPLIAPAITGQPSGQQLSPGATLTLTVTASGSAPLSYQWWKDGAVLPNGGRVSGATTATLTVSSAQTSDSGSYVVRVSNAAGEAISTPVPVTVGTGTSGVILTAAGYHHTLFLNAIGQLWGVGQSVNGELGISTPGYFNPLQIAQNVCAMSAGGNHTLYIKSDDTLWGAGLNTSGQLGDGTRMLRTSPIQIATGVVAAVAGGAHTLFLKNDGTLWGTGNNTNGQLGPTGFGDGVLTPVQIATDVVSMAGGEEHTLFVKADGSLWGLGSNFDGQLGPGLNRTSTPVLIASNVKVAAAGVSHSLYVKTDGTLWAVGDNFYGQLGDGTQTDRTTPVQVASSVVTACAKYAHSLFIKTDGTLWGMGDNYLGQLGDGTSVTRRYSPIAIATDVAGASAGRDYSMFVKNNGTLWGMGNGNAGQIVLGMGASSLIPTQSVSGSVTAPSAPTGLGSGVGMGVGSVRIYWNLALGTTSYEVWRNSGNSIGTATRVASNLTIPLFYDMSVTPGTIYFYWVRALNSAGASSYTALSVFVAVPPQITTQPLNAGTVNIGSSVTFTVVATGLPVPTFQWKRNGVNIPGATGASYSIPSAQFSDAGSYTVVASNSGGSVTSNAVTLTVTESTLASGEKRVWLMNGTAPQASVSLGQPPAGWEMAATGDFNGDGKSDIVWQNLNTGQRVIWLMNGTTFLGGGELGFIDLTWRIAGTGDFNGDGQRDIVWQNQSTGQRIVWLMNGTTYVTWADLGFVDLSWQMAGVGDFNGDNKPDIVWQNLTTGQRSIWLMNGTTFMAGAELGFVDLTWQIAAVGDFNADGKADILWQNRSTGQRSVWYMNGVTLQEGVNLWTRDIGLDLAGIGDFNGDGKMDVLWQEASSLPSDFNSDWMADLVLENSVTGERRLWLLDQNLAVTGAILPTLDTNWRLAASLDLNQDGKTDLLLRNQQTGLCRAWYMNGPNYVSAEDLWMVDPNWEIAATADLNRDGQPDLLWQNRATGQRSVWYMNGKTLLNGENLWVVEPNWDLVAATDLNRDGQADLLWQNLVTGQRSVWYMNGTTLVSGENLWMVEPDWDLVGVRDLNRDGSVDLVWQHRVSGQRSAWYLNGTTYLSGVNLWTLDPNWRFAF